MLVGCLVIAQDAALNGFLRHLKVDANRPTGIRRGGFNGEFQRVERIPRVTARDLCQVVERLGGDLDAARPIAALGIAQRALEQSQGCPARERYELKDARTGQERAVDFEIRIFSCRADQNDGAVFNVRQERVLLGFVKAVDFVNEQDGALPVQVKTLARLFDDAANVGDARQDGAQGFEMRGGTVGDDGGERGLAGAGGTPQDD